LKPIQIGTYLFVKLDESRFKLLSNFFATSEMVRELNVREGFTGLSLVSSEVLSRGLGDSVEWHGGILVVSDLLEVDVRDLVVGYSGRVVVDDIPRKLREVGCHVITKII
jgi:hypothetical protein